MKKRTSKLALNKHTVRTLDSKRLDGVGGGYLALSNTDGKCYRLGGKEYGLMDVSGESVCFQLEYDLQKI